MGNELLTQAVNPNSATTPAAFNKGFNTGMNTAMPSSLFNIPKDYSNDMLMPECLKTGNITDEQRASIFGPMAIQTQQLQTAQVQNPYNQSYPQQVQYPQTQTQYPQPSQYPTPYGQNYYTPAFSGQEQQSVQTQTTPEQLSEYYEKLLAENPNLRITDKGNPYEITSTGKRTGLLAGGLIAFSDGIIKVCKGEGLKNAFKLKNLAIKLPVLAIAGWAIGSVIDTFTNSARAQQADSQA